MKIQIQGIVENVEKYEGKNGLCANVMISNLDTLTKKRSFLTFTCKDVLKIAKFEELLQEEIYVVLELNQNNFGLRLGDVLHIEKVEEE